MGVNLLTCSPLNSHAASAWYYLTDANYNVVMLVTDSGYGVERIFYTAYGEPEVFPFGDADGDYDVDTADETLITAIKNGSQPYNILADLNLDGAVTQADVNAFGNYAGYSGGRGVLAISNGSATTGNDIGYAGYTWNDERSQWHVRHREYDPKLGRWMQRDPAHYGDPGGSLVEYSESNSLSQLDPLGLDPQIPPGAAEDPAIPPDLLPNQKQPEEAIDPDLLLAGVAIPGTIVIGEGVGEGLAIVGGVVCIKVVLVTGAVVLVCYLAYELYDSCQPFDGDGVKRNRHCRKMYANYKSLQAANSACTTQDTCAGLRKKASRFIREHDLREYFQRDCVKPWARDAGHVQAIRDAAAAAIHCAAIMRQKKCWFIPEYVPMHEREYRKRYLCFVGDTQVWTLDGLKALSCLSINDRVCAYDAESCHIVQESVEAVFKGHARQLIRIELAGEVLLATPQHPVLVVGEGWVQAGMLRAGMRVQTITAGEVALESVSIAVYKDDIEVFTLRIPGAQTFAVGRIGMVVHNK